MIPLRQSTASQEIPLGYFLDSTDGNTEETGLTIANTDIKLWKAGATAVVSKNSGGATHISNGLYYATLDATDTDTAGPLVIFVHVSGALAVKVDCVVYPATVFDALFGSGYLSVNTVQIEGSDATNQIRDAVVDDATRIDASALNTLSGHDPGATIAKAGDEMALTAGAISAIWSAATRTLTSFGTLVSDIWSAGTRTLTSFGTLASDVWAVATRTLTSFGTLASDVWSAATRSLTDKADFSLTSAYDAAKTAASASALSTVDGKVDAIKAKTDNLPASPAATGDIPSAGTIADAVWDEAISGHLASGSTGAALNAAGSAGDPWATTLPGAYGSGTAGYIVGNTLDAAVTSRASASALSTTDGKIDAIKAKTDNLPTDPADDSDIDAQLSTITSHLTDIKGTTFNGVTDSLEAIRDRGDAAWTTATGFSTLDAAGVRSAVGMAAANLDTQLGSLATASALSTTDGKVDGIKAVTDALTVASASKLALSAGTIVSGTVSHDNTPATTTVFYSDDITEATADHFNGRIVIFTTGALQYQATDITDYELEAGEGKFTVTALTEAPADNVTFIIV